MKAQVSSSISVHRRELLDRRMKVPLLLAATIAIGTWAFGRYQVTVGYETNLFSVGLRASDFSEDVTTLEGINIMHQLRPGCIIARTNDPLSDVDLRPIQLFASTSCGNTLIHQRPQIPVRSEYNSMILAPIRGAPSGPLDLPGDGHHGTPQDPRRLGSHRDETSQALTDLNDIEHRGIKSCIQSMPPRCASVTLVLRWVSLLKHLVRPFPEQTGLWLVHCPSRNCRDSQTTTTVTFVARPNRFCHIWWRDAYVVRIMREIGANEAKFMISSTTITTTVPAGLPVVQAFFFYIIAPNTTTMSPNEHNDNNVAIPTVCGGFSGVASDGFVIQQLAVHAMKQSGAAGVVVQMSAQGQACQDNPTAVTGVTDRDGNFHVVHHTNETDPASLVLRSLFSSTIITTNLCWSSRLPSPLPILFNQYNHYRYHAFQREQLHRHPHRRALLLVANRHNGPTGGWSG
ncbi:hypothetical protein FPCIR_1245 [Fusarium pseudocircinatum]|uniref:Uncharacterized protein n=1 Tax=Fusarium pseudocircinatum TaxID=56676 RepID=A0A8H5UZ87_9HYPO|nr:hypothetical protein FPCIR_1245 [Fusarium pseudocircinatum]